MAIDWNVLGTAVVGIIIAIGTYFQTKSSTAAKYESQTAEYNAETAASRAERDLYNQLRNRLEDCEKDITSLRRELNEERNRGRDLETHIWKLERLMRDAGLEVPPFVITQPIIMAGRD